MNGFGASGKASWGDGLTQNDLMEKDTVLLLDDEDNVIGSASKKDSHVFSAEQPYGQLHRAFSVFIFDETDGRLLLQQRASSKITFPDVSNESKQTKMRVYLRAWRKVETEQPYRFWFHFSATWGIGVFERIARSYLL